MRVAAAQHFRMGRQMRSPGRAAVGEIPAVEADAQRLRHRILQCDGRRYSLKLEPAYWTSLEAAAKQRNLRLAQLIRDLAAQLPQGSSLSARIRQFCLEETQSAALHLKDELASHALVGDAYDLAAIVAACPIPCLVVSHAGRIDQANRAFGRWRKADPEQFLGKRLDQYFQLRLPLPLASMAAQAITGGARHSPAKIAFIAPGRIIVAQATICLIAIRDLTDFAYLVMIQSGAHD
jgi:predicted DNA-binding ribbon-helix-helix protein